MENKSIVFLICSTLLYCAVNSCEVIFSGTLIFTKFSVFIRFEFFIATKRFSNDYETDINVRFTKYLIWNF